MLAKPTDEGLTAFIEPQFLSRFIRQTEEPHPIASRDHLLLQGEGKEFPFAWLAHKKKPAILADRGLQF